MEKVMHDSPEAKGHPAAMEEVRCDLAEDVQVIVEDAREHGPCRADQKPG